MKQWLFNISKLTIGFLLLCCSSVLQGQTESDCRVYLQEYLNRMNTIDVLTSEKVYYLKMSMQIAYNPAYTQTTNFTSTSEMIRASDYYIYQDDYSAIYFDGEEAYTVIHPKEIILLVKEKKWDKYFQKKNKHYVLQDSIVANGAIAYTPLSNSMLLISVSPIPIHQKVFKIERLEYWYNSETGLVNKYIIHHTKDHKIQRQTIRFEKLDFDHQGLKKKRAKDFLFDPNGNLKENLKHYQLLNASSYN